ncbi:unnamed protein product [Adineta steineri]|uniref:Uncharacterized protein n=1 Tax=Adineta steineri TaxID=433720 RepID=A0A819LQ92_9BILA|nr:unnamed protein product [Adineta steineri]
MFWLLLPNGFNTQDISSISIINNEDSTLDKDTSFLININEKDLLMDIYFGNDIFMDNNRSESANYEQIPNMIDTPSSSNDQSINEEIISKITNQYEIDVKKILYLSNLNEQITKNDLRSYFIGSTKIILKQSQLPPYLIYVFIFHRTNLRAQYN